MGQSLMPCVLCRAVLCCRVPQAMPLCTTQVPHRAEPQAVPALRGSTLLQLLVSVWGSPTALTHGCLPLYSAGDGRMRGSNWPLCCVSTVLAVGVVSL